MKKRHVFNLNNKIKRINYIKTELNQLVKRVLISSKSLTKLKCANTIDPYIEESLESSKAKHRLFCNLSSSPKIVTKKFKLGRFAFATLSNLGKIGGITKRGW